MSHLQLPGSVPVRVGSWSAWADGPLRRLAPASAGDIRGARVRPQLAQGSPVRGHLSLHSDSGNNEVPTPAWVLPGNLGL